MKPSGRPALGRFALFVPGALSLMAGMWSGLARLGVPVPSPGAEIVVGHGPIMLSGFLATLISLERAVALGRTWGWAAPALCGTAAVAMLAGASHSVLPPLVHAAGLAFVGVSAAVAWKQPASFTLTMLVGTLCWFVGNAVWLAGSPVFAAVPWWAAFLVLTIAGERLELSRLGGVTPAATRVFAAIVAVYLLAIAATPVWPDTAPRVMGAALIALASWLVRWDVARRTVRTSGLPRYVAVCLLTGYGWLTLAGALMIALGMPIAGPQYDAIWHSLFVGFVLAMIFGHAPIVFPAVFRISVPYTPLMYGWLALLQTSLAVRIGADLVGATALRQWGGTANVVAIAGFLLTVALRKRG